MIACSFCKKETISMRRIQLPKVNKSIYLCDECFKGTYKDSQKDRVLKTK